MVHANAKQAERLEAEAAAYPEEREEILIEAAGAWQRAGQPDRARAILDDLIRGGGDYGRDARIELADMFLEAGDAEHAHAQLDALAKDPATEQHQCELAAELLAEQGDLKQAARWYDRAADRLTNDELDALHVGDDHISTGTVIMLRNRRRIREQLDRVPDRLDTLVDDLPDLDDPVTTEELLDVVRSGGALLPARMLTFQRDQRRLAQQQWPGQYDEPDDVYYAAAEHRWHELRDSGVASIIVVPAQVDDLLAFARKRGGSATDSRIKQGYCETVPDSVAIAWPPGRNAACWCGSGTKYKKCCGRPR